MQSKPVALVTGANQGIGLQIAKNLVTPGFTALVGSPKLERAAAAAREDRSDAHALQREVAHQASIVLRQQPCGSARFDLATSRTRARRRRCSARLLQVPACRSAEALWTTGKTVPPQAALPTRNSIESQSFPLKP